MFGVLDQINYTKGPRNFRKVVKQTTFFWLLFTVILGNKYINYYLTFGSENKYNLLNTDTAF